MTHSIDHHRPGAVRRGGGGAKSLFDIVELAQRPIELLETGLEPVDVLFGWQMLDHRDSQTQATRRSGDFTQGGDFKPFPIVPSLHLPGETLQIVEARLKRRRAAGWSICHASALPAPTTVRRSCPKSVADAISSYTIERGCLA